MISPRVKLAALAAGLLFGAAVFLYSVASYKQALALRTQIESEISVTLK
jgi:hypothetical protein